MNTRYSQEFREQAIQKLLQRGDKTIACIAVELNINIFTLKHWLGKYRPEIMATHKAAKRPIDWTSEERFQALLSSHGLEAEAMKAPYEGMRIPRTRLVYICSSARCGSTVTDMFPGGHPDVTSLGEINFLGKAVAL